MSVQNERMRGQKSEQIRQWIDEQTDRLTKRHIDLQTDIQTYIKRPKDRNGRKNRWMDREK
jgi:hypothetical protein